MGGTASTKSSNTGKVVPMDPLLKDTEQSNTSSNIAKQTGIPSKMLPTSTHVPHKQMLESNLYKQFKKDTLSISPQLQESIEFSNRCLGPFKKSRILKEIFKTCEAQPVVLVGGGKTMYIGQWSQGFQCGFGQQIENGNIYYIGFFFMNKKQGFGRMVYDDGGFYEGEWNMGVPSGVGTFYDKQGRIQYQKQTMDITDIQKNQAPSQIINNQSKYYGEIVQGVKSGEGLQQWEDGTYYLGEFENDLRNGLGNMVYVTGNSYKGSYLKNRMEGIGHYTWADGKYYYGGYKNDLKEGFGIYFTGNGKFEGFFKGGKMNGKGSYFDIRNKTSTQGFWEQGKKLSSEEVKKRGYELQ